MTYILSVPIFRNQLMNDFDQVLVHAVLAPIVIGNVVSAAECQIATVFEKVEDLVVVDVVDRHHPFGDAIDDTFADFTTVTVLSIINDRQQILGNFHWRQPSFVSKRLVLHSKCIGSSRHCD
eukprot:09716.XXX_238109_238474_1 [CDS] Oithona nana genome sequencing.